MFWMMQWLPTGSGSFFRSSGNPSGLQRQPVVEVSSAAAGSSSNILQTAHGLEVPGTPQEVPGPVAPVSPRHSPTTRTHATDVDEGESKRAKTEEHKKQRINRLAEEQESMMRTVRFGTETYHTLDSYEAAFQSDDVESSEEVWIGENDLYFAGVTEKLGAIMT